MYKQIFIVNKSLGMRAGKIAGQVAHGETLYMKDINKIITGDAPEDLPRYSKFLEWCGEITEDTPIGKMTKIIKKANEEELRLIMSVLDTMNNVKYYKVYDLGKTQIEKESLTCICVEPLESKLCDELFEELSLL